MRMLLCMAVLLLTGISGMSQNTGIGYPTPYGKLTIGHLVTPSSPTLALFEGFSTGGPRIHFNNAGGSATWIAYADIDNAIGANSVLGFAYANEALPVLALRGNSRVGINQLSPGYTLDVNGDANLTGALRINGTAGSSGQVLVSNGSSAPSWQTLATTPSPIGFSARLSGNVVVTNGTNAVFTSYAEQFDDGAIFNPANGRFTAPSDGMYQLHVQANLTISSGSIAQYNIRFLLNGNIFVGCQTNGVVSQETINVTGMITNTVNIKMLAGDFVTIEFNNTTSTANSISVSGNGGSNNSIFTAFKVY